MKRGTGRTAAQGRWAGGRATARARPRADGRLRLHEARIEHVHACCKCASGQGAPRRAVGSGGSGRRRPARLCWVAMACSTAVGCRWRACKRPGHCWGIDERGAARPPLLCLYVCDQARWVREGCLERRLDAAHATADVAARPKWIGGLGAQLTARCTCPQKHPALPCCPAELQRAAPTWCRPQRCCRPLEAHSGRSQAGEQRLSSAAAPLVHVRLPPLPQSPLPLPPRLPLPSLLLSSHGRCQRGRLRAAGHRPPRRRGHVLGAHHPGAAGAGPARRAAVPVHRFGQARSSSGALPLLLPC